MTSALTCPWCGAPFPRLAPGAPRVACMYCGSTSSLVGERATREAASPAGPRAVDPTLAGRVIEAFKAARAQGSSFHAISVAARERLGPLGETEAFARVVLGMARDFDREHGTRVEDDPIPVSRLIEAYLRALEGVRARGYEDVKLSFFAVTGRGPLDFTRRLTADGIAELAARDPNAKPKRKFWPFG